MRLTFLQSKAWLVWNFAPYSYHQGGRSWISIPYCIIKAYLHSCLTSSVPFTLDSKVVKHGPILLMHHRRISCGDRCLTIASFIEFTAFEIFYNWISAHPTLMICSCYPNLNSIRPWGLEARGPVTTVDTVQFSGVDIVGSWSTIPDLLNVIHVTSFPGMSYFMNLNSDGSKAYIRAIYLLPKLWSHIRGGGNGGARVTHCT